MKELEAAPLTAFDELTSPKTDAHVATDDVPNSNPRGASLFTLLVVSMPRMATQMAWAAQWAALGPYLGTMLPKFAFQLTQIVGPLSGILVGPIVGVKSDRSTNKWGRRRPFLVIAGVLSIFCWVLMGYTREMGEALGDYGNGKDGTMTSRKWTAFLTVCFYIWMDITVNVVQTPAILLVADIAGDRQTTGAVLGQSWGIVGSVVVSAYIEIWGPAHLSLHSFLGMLSSVMTVSLVVVCVTVHKTPLEPAEVTSSTTSTGARIREALYAIVAGLRALPHTLAVRFFGLVVFGGQAANADNCSPACSRAQDDYNRGVQLAGGVVDLACALVGCTFSLLLPLAVRRVGAKWVLTTSLVPQACLIAMAFSKIVSLNVVIVVLASFSQCVVFALVTPLIVHVMGAEQDIGVYVGALNSASCFGQLLNFSVGAAVVETPMGYQLPVLLGGAMGLLGLLVSAAFFQVKMYSL